METPEWLNATEVSALFVQAGLFRVPRSTLRRWTLAGRIKSVRTAGGHRRYSGPDARALIAETLNPGARQWAARNSALVPEAVA
ncbi:MAG TPA: MerR family DNA-binding transcriptional regulator [Trebonia sp.]|nr:MerR family DNA-binding transcriptional regulator [Trebonia sp.]